MTNSKRFDLEDRTYEFAKDVRMFTKKLPRTIAVIEDSKQVIRSSGSIAANYIEANESFSRKDFLLRTKICKKEAKETRLWLRLLGLETGSELEKERQRLLKEVEELMKIFGAIIEKSK